MKVGQLFYDFALHLCKVLYLCVIMKKKATLELIEQSDVVSLYSISFEMDRTTEFERFMQKFESEASFNKDYQKIIYALHLILEKGALERYFRPEGSMNDEVCALPIESGKLRLYCLRISDQILIIGNGGEKHTQTYQEDKTLYGYVVDLQKFDAILKKEMEDGGVCVMEKKLDGVDDKYFEI